MECERARTLLSALLDNALGFWPRFRLTRHLARCADCAGTLEELRSMQSVMRTKLTYHRAPPGLAARIGASLPREAPPVPTPSWRRFPAWSLAGTGLAGALAGVALTLAVVSGPGNGAGNSVTEAVIDSHVSSMMANHLTDVLTSDQHTVKPWLSARLDFSPVVRDYVAQGYPLVGGRLDYIDGHPAAAIVYHRAKHVINLFAWAAPGQPDAPFRSTTQQGFHIIRWRQGGINYAAVSDVEENQLAEFARLVAAPG
jgi:anti-sigma factor RsiW